MIKRIPIKEVGASYDEIKNFFEKEIQKTTSTIDLISIYKELHALLVSLAKNNCWKKKPKCHTCPLNTLCEKSL